MSTERDQRIADVQHEQAMRDLVALTGHYRLRFLAWLSGDESVYDDESEFAARVTRRVRDNSPLALAGCMNLGGSGEGRD